MKTYITSDCLTHFRILIIRPIKYYIHINLYSTSGEKKNHRYAEFRIKRTQT